MKRFVKRLFKSDLIIDGALTALETDYADFDVLDVVVRVLLGLSFLIAAALVLVQTKAKKQAD